MYVRSSPGGRAALRAMQRHRLVAERRLQEQQQQQQQSEGDGDQQQQAAEQPEQRHPSDALRAWLNASSTELAAAALAAARTSAAAAAAAEPSRAEDGGAGGGDAGGGHNGGGDEARAEDAAASAAAAAAAAAPLPPSARLLRVRLADADAAAARGGGGSGVLGALLGLGRKNGGGGGSDDQRGGGASRSSSSSSSSASGSGDKHGAGNGGGDNDSAGAADEVAVGVFSPAVVQNGYTAFVSRLHEARALPPAAAPLAAHFSWAGRSKESRLHRMREAMWYADGPAYYSDPLLLSFDPGPPGTPPGFSNWTANEDMLAVHVQSLEAQLAEFYAAAALALALGRVLVLPRLACHCFRHSAPVAACRAPGDAAAQLPFTCTLEQVFKPKALYAHLPVYDGRRLLFREHSFLDNKRTPSWVKHAKTEVLPGRPNCGNAASGTAQQQACVEVSNATPPRGVNQQLVLPAGSDDATIAELLRPHAKAKLLHLPRPSALFGGFRDAARRQRFDLWIDTVLAPWCCRTPEDALARGAMRAVRVRARLENARRGGDGGESGGDTAAAAAAATAAAEAAAAAQQQAAVAAVEAAAAAAAAAAAPGAAAGDAAAPAAQDVAAAAAAAAQTAAGAQPAADGGGGNRRQNARR